MKENVIDKSERRMSGTAMFWSLMFVIVGIGTTIAYCSGIMNGIGGIARAPFTAPDWLVIALPPVLLFHQALAMYFMLKQNVYTTSGRMVRLWTWGFQIALFLMLAFLPYFVFHGVPVGAYITAALACAAAIGATVLTYRMTTAGGVLMTILLAVLLIVMLYLGYWAFA